MDEWNTIKQGAPGQPKQIKDIAIKIQQLADDIDEGKTIGWKQRIIHLLEAMRPELRIKVEPEVNLTKDEYNQAEYTRIAQVAAKHDRILHQLGAYRKSQKKANTIHLPRTQNRFNNINRKNPKDFNKGKLLRLVKK